MRQTFRILGIGLWSLFTLDIAIAIIDWLARWDWLETLLGAHPHVAAFVRTPFVYLLLLIFGFLFLVAERKLKLPGIAARFTNSRIIPNLHTVTIGAFFDSADKKPGWDLQRLDWWWFVEIQLANDSDTRTTIDSIEVRVKTGRNVEQAILFDDVGKFAIDMGYDRDSQTKSYVEPRYRHLPDLQQLLRNVPLERGIGYRGWLRVQVKQVNQKDMNGGRIKIDVWLIDALQGKHKVHYKKKSDQAWDKSFLVFEET